MTKGEYIRRRGRLLKRLLEKRKWLHLNEVWFGMPLSEVRKSQNSLCYIRHQYYSE